MLRKTSSNFSMFTKLKNLIKPSVAVGKNILSPTGEDHGALPTSDLDFEAVA